jgi:hypothetical protein
VIWGGWHVVGWRRYKNFIRVVGCFSSIKHTLFFPGAAKSRIPGPMSSVSSTFLKLLAIPHMSPSLSKGP